MDYKSKMWTYNAGSQDYRQIFEKNNDGVLMVLDKIMHNETTPQSRKTLFFTNDSITKSFIKVLETKFLMTNKELNINGYIVVEIYNDQLASR